MVNSLYDLFDAPGEKPEAEQLIVNGRYMLPPIGDPTGKRRSLQRVTNFIGQISDKTAIAKWQSRSALQGLASREDLYDLASSLDFGEKHEWEKLVERCIDAAKAWQGSGGNETGTALHNYTDGIDGKTPLRVRPKWIPKVENYKRALHEQGLRVVPGLSERLVVSERYGTCGRLDDVYENVHGVRYIADRKSQKEFYTWLEIGAQLALYQASDAMWNEQESRFEDMPALSDEEAIVAWMPITHPSTDPEAVSLYRVQLEAPRRLLDLIHEVRGLRSSAVRRWASPMPELTAFERIARDIRDANSTQDLVKIRDFNLPNWSEQLHLMAAKRWDAIEAEAKAHPAYVPELSTRNLADVPAVASHPVVPTAKPDTAASSASHFEFDWSAIGAGLPQPYQASQDISLNGEVKFEPRRIDDTVSVQVESSTKFGEDETTLAVTGTHDAIAQFAHTLMQPTQEQFEQEWQRFAEMFKAPEEATFPAESEQRRADDVSATIPTPVLTAMNAIADRGIDFECRFDGKRVSEHPVNMPGQFHCISPEPRPDAGSGDVLRKPMEWATHLGLELIIQADSDGVWCKPMPLKSFRSLYATEIALADVNPRIVDGVTQRPSTTDERAAYAAKLQEQPTTTASYDQGQHHGAMVVELPADVPTTLPAQAGVDELAAVPIKIVREVAKRAANSQSSRGRVRLLNDVETAKYAKHAGALMPALLAEWLEIDGGPVAGGTYIDNTGGSKRAPMEASDAGPVSLSQFLASQDEEVPERAPKKGSAAPAQGDTDAFGQPVADVSSLPEAPAEQQGIRRQYGDITPDKHSVLRLVEMAKEAANGGERGLVFRELARRRAMTGAIAAEINQHYLDSGYAVEDFDPYFEQQNEQPLPANSLPGCRPVFDTLRDATLAELIAAALDAETPSERGKAVFEIARRDAWGRMPIQELNIAWTNEGLPGIPAILTVGTDANHLRVVLPRIQACQTVSDLHTLWEDLHPLPCFHSEQAQEALQMQLRSVSP